MTKFQNELERLIEKRDTLRREAHESLTAFRDATSKLHVIETVSILKVRPLKLFVFDKLEMFEMSLFQMVKFQ